MLDVGVIRIHLAICLFLSPPYLLVVITNCPICHFCYAHKVGKNVKTWGWGGGRLDTRQKAYEWAQLLCS